MPIQPIRDIAEFKRIKDSLKDRFESERSGDQDLFREKTKALQPLITSQQETAKAIENKIAEESANKALLSLATELQRRNDQVDMLAEQPYYHQEIPAISGPPDASKDIMQINLDNGLNQTDIENLEDMSFELPSKVFENKSIEKTLEKIKKENRSIGAYLGKSSKKSDREKEIYESRKKTLKIYQPKIEAMQKATKELLGAPERSGEGVKNTHDIIVYSSADDLCVKLSELHAAKQAGNTGLDNTIISILDELLRIKVISKDGYDNLYKSIFD